ncbi:hypothetical protein FXO38_08300 [Capsicum annuum]|nr:hypothetical protein FXO38_08300 [Capsicum annuum]
MVERQFSKVIKIFLCDGGGEFIKTEFIKHLESCGIVRHISYPNTPEQNGISKRKQRYIVETGLTMLLHANLPLFLWVEAFLTTMFLINRLLSSVLKMTPFVKLYGAPPDYNRLKAHDSIKVTPGEVLPVMVNQATQPTIEDQATHIVDQPAPADLMLPTVDNQTTPAKPVLAILVDDNKDSSSISENKSSEMFDISNAEAIGDATDPPSIPQPTSLCV